MREVPPEERQLVEALDCYVRKFGIRQTMVRACRRFNLPVPAALMTAARDAQRHRRMVDVLKTDPDLLYRQGKLGERRLLSEAARRAIKEDAQPSELDPDGEPDAEIVKRLVGKFPYFRWDDRKRSFDKGLWF
jgi:hypothetical protein